MDILDKDILEVWSFLNKNQVKYIMIGGFAVNLHGFRRFTEDMDLWILDTLQNRQNLRKAFLELGIGDLPSLENIEFISGWTDFHMSSNLVLDLMTTIPGLENISFEECLASASIGNIEGIEVPFLHINHLIMAKEATKRPKDLIDLAELQKIKLIRDTPK